MAIKLAEDYFLVKSDIMTSQLTPEIGSEANAERLRVCRGSSLRARQLAQEKQQPQDCSSSIIKLICFLIVAGYILFSIAYAYRFSYA